MPVITSLAFSVVVLWNCTPGLMPPAETDMKSAQKYWNDVTHAQLQEGYNLYKNKCGSCHYLYKPDKFSNEKWAHEILEMSHKIRLDSAEVSNITRYVLTAKETKSFAGK